eukprot:61291_1
MSDLFVHVGGQRDFQLDDKIHTVIEQYQKKMSITSSLNLFFNHFVPPDNINWGHGLARLNKKWHYVEQLSLKEIVNAEWKWFDPHRIFFDKLTKYPNISILQKIWKDRLDFHTERWDKELAFDEMGTLDTCLWVEHVLTKHKQNASWCAIEELQNHFMNKEVTWECLNQVQLNTN